MSRRLPPLNALKSFEAAARHVSFKRASEELHVTQGAVSHQVKSLEEALGVKFFNRQPQGLVITSTGREYLNVVRNALDDIAAGTDKLLHRQRAGVLTVSVSPNFATKWLVHRLGRFAQDHPTIDLQIRASARLTDFAREDVDVTIRYNERPPDGLNCTRLYTEELFPVCSPELLRGPHPLKTPADLVHFPMLHLDHRHEWARWLENAGLNKAELTHGPVLNQASMVIDAAVDGQGVALARTALVARDLILGRLVRPLPLALPVSHAYWIVCPKAVAKLPKIIAFQQWLLCEVAEDIRKLSQPQSEFD